MRTPILSLAVLVSLAWLAGCSGASEPTPSGTGFDSQGISGSGGAASSPTTGSAPCANEGATLRCGQEIAVTDGMLTCTVGTRTCTGGSWSACDTSPGLTAQYPVQLGCSDMPTADAPAPAPCAEEGQTRDCLVDPADNHSVHDCFHGVQVCTNGAWGACRAPSSRK